MNILFYISDVMSRNDNYNGENIRFGNVGVSGTEQSMIIIAEYLALHNYNCYYYCNVVKKGVYNNVTYIDNADMIQLTDIIDILICPSWENSIINYTWNCLKKLIIWCQCPTFLNENVLYLMKYNNEELKIYANIMGNYVANVLNNNYSYYKKYIDIEFIIRNPLMMDLFTNNNNIKKLESFIFFASFERGGEVACKAFDKLSLKNKSMDICSYVKIDLDKKYNISISNKKNLFDKLASSEYFIYPLVLPSYNNYSVHKDTDACVIAESLLHEVIVLTYPVGVLPEVYKDYLVWLPFPPEADVNNLKSSDTSYCPSLYSEFAIDSIVNIIEFLEANPSAKELIKKRGKQFIIDQRNQKTITDSWLSIIN
jgi:glycosyltransferase involved in cell wall biosynthesis